MKKNSGMVSTFTWVTAFFFVLVLFFSNHAMGGEAQIIRIYSSIAPEESVSIQPKEVWVSPGTIVIWNNWAETEAKILKCCAKN